jgi:1-deoxy-D-xylulose-5-phosphate synthase
MLKSAFGYGHPAAIRFPKGEAVGVPMDKEFRAVPLGKSERLKEGRDLLLAFGSMVYPALAAAEELEKDGISLAVVDAKFARPLDEDMLLRYAEPGRTIITAEEGVTAGGFGSVVRDFLDRQEKFDVRFKQIGIPLEIYPMGKARQIKKIFRLDAEGLVSQIKEFYHP